MAQESRRDAKAGKDDAARKDGKGDDYEFVPPDFDEDGFIHREMVSFRTTLILFGWGIVAALASWALFAAMGGARTGWLVGLLLCAGFGFALKWLFPKLGADIAHFGRREWLGTAALFFFTWLSFFIVAVNPPVSDFGPPRAELFASPLAQDPSGTVSIHLFVEDNVAVEEHTFRVTTGGDPVASEGDLVDLGRGHYRYDASGLAPGLYDAEATATDARGHEGRATLRFAVTEGLVTVSSGDGVLRDASERVLVTVRDLPACPVRGGEVASRDPCIRTVRLDLAGGGNVTLRLDDDELQPGWVATTENAGWRPGNNTFHVVAELADRYHGHGEGAVRFDGGSIRSGPHTVDVRATPGSLQVPEARDPDRPTQDIPGAGLPLLAAGLLAAGLLARRRRGP